LCTSFQLFCGYASPCQEVVGVFVAFSCAASVFKQNAFSILANFNFRFVPIFIFILK
jgi:hypothetical protein